MSSADESDPDPLPDPEPDPESEEPEFLLLLDPLDESDSSLLDESWKRSLSKKEFYELSNSAAIITDIAFKDT